MSEHHSDNTKIIAFVGLTGSGKTSAVDYLAEKGWPKIYVGGFIVQGVIDQGLEVTPDNERTYRESMREQHGKEVFMNMGIEEAQRLIDAGQRKIVFDGLYTWTEYKLLKKAFHNNLHVVALVTPKQLRHHRLTTRPIRPLTIEEANQRDYAEIENLEKGGPIAIADYFVHNDKDVEHLHRQIDTILYDLHA